VFPIIVTFLDSTNMASRDRFVAVGGEEILYIISNIFAKPQVFYYLVFDAKIFDIIYQLSPLLECDPTVCLPEKSKVTRGLAIIVCNVARRSINIYDVVNILFSLGDKLSGHTPTRMIIA
jgi:hypothetical protein